MKKILSTLVGIMLFTTVSHASKARLNALGQDGDGSLYILDNRNIFLNPSTLNDVKSGIYTEWGSNPEGGFVKYLGGMKFGFHMGSDSAPDYNGKYLHSGNGLDFFLAGESRVKWGVALSYVSNELKDGDDDVFKESSTGLKLGASRGNWSAFAHLGLGGKAEGSIFNDEDGQQPDDINDVAEGKSSYTLGGTYNVGQGTVFLKYKTGETEVSGVDTNLSKSATSLGWHNGHDMGDNGMWFYTLSYDKETAEGGAFDLDFEDTALKSIIGFEAQGASWLTLRGSVSQRTFINEGSDGSVPNTTAVAAGATLNFGSLSIDGSLGSIGDASLNAFDLLSDVALSYSF